MPRRQARSETRGLPPFGLGTTSGRRGSINSHRASGMSATAMSGIPPPDRCLAPCASRQEAKGFVRGSNSQLLARIGPKRPYRIALRQPATSASPPWSSRGLQNLGQIRRPTFTGPIAASCLCEHRGGYDSLPAELQPLIRRDYDALRAYGGIAPVTRRSGKKTQILMRLRLQHSPSVNFSITGPESACYMMNRAANTTMGCERDTSIQPSAIFAGRFLHARLP